MIRIIKKEFFMKKYSISALVVLIGICFGQAYGDDTLRICTYNIRRMGSESDQNNIWQNRKGLVFGIVNKIKPDIVGFQEAVKEQFDDLRDVFDDSYGSFGKARSAKMDSWWQKFVMKNPKAKDEHNPLFYNTYTVKLLDSGDFGINPRGRIMHAHLPRICTWGFFENKDTGKKFYVYNTHLDNSSGLIRKRQIQKILQHVKKHTVKDPVIIMGDFNTKLSGKTKTSLFSKAGFVHAKTIAKSVEGPKETRTGWNNKQLKTIDHIFVRPRKSMVEKYVVVASPEGVFPSDHRPVFIDIVE